MYSVTIAKPGIELRIKDSLILGDRETFLENWSGSDVITIKAKATDTAITGGGVVDGRGEAWWGHIDEYRPITVAAKAAERGAERAILSGDRGHPAASTRRRIPEKFVFRHWTSPQDQLIGSSLSVGEHTMTVGPS